MKKIFVGLFAAALALPGFAAVWSPAQIADGKLALEKAAHPHTKGDCEANLMVVGSDDPVSFDEILTKCDAAFRKHGFTKEYYIRLKACQIACWHYDGKFVADAWKTACLDNNSFRWYLAKYHQRTLGLTDADLAGIIEDKIFSPDFSLPTIRQMVTDYLRIAPTLDEVKVKNVLKKMNRYFTPKASADASYTPVVSMIRNALSVY